MVSQRKAAQIALLHAIRTVYSIFRVRESDDLPNHLADKFNSI